jgi:hypothetical protein
MSAIVRVGRARPPRSMVFVPGKGAAFGEVDVYRDGEAVVVVGAGGGVKQTPHGNVEARVTFSTRFPSIQAYEWARDRAFEKDPVRYSKIVGLLGIDDDARNAPDMPPEVRRFVEGEVMALPSARSVEAVRSPLLLCDGDEEMSR